MSVKNLPTVITSGSIYVHTNMMITCVYTALSEVLAHVCIRDADDDDESEIELHVCRRCFI